MINLKKAKEHSLKDRLRYKKYYDTIDKYIKVNNIVIGGKLGIKLLFDDEKEYDDFDYHLYTEIKTDELLKELVSIGDFIVSKNSINRTIVLKIDTRPIVFIHNEDYPSIDVDGYKLLSHSVWLEHIFYILINIDLIDQWEFWEKYINRLMKMFLKDKPMMEYKSNKFPDKLKIVMNYLENIDYGLLDKTNIITTNPNMVLNELKELFSFEYRKYGMGFLYKINIKVNKSNFINIYGFNNQRLIPIVENQAHRSVKLFYLFSNYNNLIKLNVNTKFLYLPIKKEYEKPTTKFKTFIGSSDERIKYPQL